MIIAFNSDIPLLFGNWYPAAHKKGKFTSKTKWNHIKQATEYSDYKNQGKFSLPSGLIWIENKYL